MVLRRISMPVGATKVACGALAPASPVCGVGSRPIRMPAVFQPWMLFCRICVPERWPGACTCGDVSSLFGLLKEPGEQRVARRDEDADRAALGDAGRRRGLRAVLRRQRAASRCS